MAKFKEDGIGVSELLELVPDDLFSELTLETKVDYQVKKLYGYNVFRLLLYGMLESERLGLRSLEDYYNSWKFKALFNIPGTSKIKYNSLSARLATMNVSFFEKAYEAVYGQCGQLYDTAELSGKYNITRVDSTMVCQTARKLEQGINLGCKKDGKKQIKYTISLTNLLPSSVEVFYNGTGVNENKTIPKVISKVLDKQKDNVFVFDRGVSERNIFCNLNDENCSFVTRLKVDARHLVVEELQFPAGLIINNLTVIRDQKIFLYRSGDHVVEYPFRLIQTQNAKGNQYWFLTNRFDFSCEDVILIYKSRWDIEVFFRFIKQELNFSHFISVNLNGIKIVLYMTLILAMLILIYKKINNFGYKTAKRRFSIELWDIVTAIIVRYCGGDPSLVFR